MSRARNASSTHEKPEPSVAARLVAQGRLWNSFVMVFRVERMLELLCRERPLELERMRCAVDQPGGLAALYASLTSWNLSRDFLTRVPEHLVVVRAEHTGWSDWGTRESIERTLRALDRTPPWWTTPAFPSCG